MSTRACRESLILPHAGREGLSARLLLANSPLGRSKLVRRCRTCQFHAKQIHQPAQALHTIPLSWQFAVWGLDILGPVPKAVGAYEWLYVAINKFTKCPEATAVIKANKNSALKLKTWCHVLASRTESSPTTGPNSPVRSLGIIVTTWSLSSASPLLLIHKAMARQRGPMHKSSRA